MKPGTGPEIERRSKYEFQFHEYHSVILACAVAVDSAMQTNPGFKIEVILREHTLEIVGNERESYHHA